MSNLGVLSKLLERLVCKQLMIYFRFISFHLFADNIAIYKAGTVISRLQVNTGQ